MSIKSPIIDSVVELQFENSMPTQVLVGLLYQKFEGTFRVEDQPVLQLPAEIRQNDANLKLQPLYKLVGEEYILSVGDGIVGLSVIVDGSERYYPGWEVYKEFIGKVIEFLDEITIATKFSKVDVRYVNSFEEGIVSKTRTEVKVSDKVLNDNQNVTLFFEKQADGIQIKVQLASKANVKSAYLNLDGSIVDIGASEANETKLEDLNDKIQILHDIVEDTFFDLVKSEALPSGVTGRHSSYQGLSC